MIQKLSIVGVVHSDREKALEFYRDVLGLPVQEEDPKFEWCELGPEKNGTMIAPYKTEWALEGANPGSANLIFLTDDIKAEYQRLVEKGVKFQGPPEKQEWGGTQANLQGPDGIWISLVQLP